MDEARRPPPLRRTLLRYAVAVLAVAVAAGVRLALGAGFGGRVPYLLFVLAIAAAAAHGGLRPGLAATALAFGLAVGLFLDLPTEPSDRVGAWVTVGLFAATGAMVSGLVEALHAARRRTEAQRDALARQTAAVQNLDDRLIAAEGAAGTVAWDWDLTAGTCVRSPSAAAVYGLDPRATAEEFLTLVHPDDREPLRAAWDRAAGGEEFRAEFRLLHPDGRTVWLADRGRLRKHPLTGRPHLSGVCVDETARRQAEEALRRSEERFRSLVAASAPVLYRMAPDWAVMLELTGSRHVPETARPRADWLTAYVAAADHERVTAAVEQAIRTGEPFEVEHRVPWADGGEGWVFSRAVPVRDAAGTLIEWFGAVTDVTPRRRAEEAVRASEERFRQLADAVPQIVYVTDHDGRMEFVNRRWNEYTGRSAADPPDLPALVHPDDLPELTRRWEAAQDAGTVLEAEFRLRRAADGADRWFLTRSVPVPGPDGRPARWYGTSTDIDDQKALENDLRTSEERYRTLFERVDQGFCVAEVLFDPAGRPIDYRFLEVNPAFERHTGLPAAAGRTAVELVPDLDRSWFDMYGRVVVTGQPVRVENEAPSMGRWFDVYACRLGDPAARTVAILFTDVTARKRAEAERERLLAEVQAERQRLADVFQQAPSFMAVLIGPDHVFERANDRYLEVVAGRALIGRSVRQALPEVVGQGFIELLDQVYRTGEPFVGREVRVELLPDPGRPPDELFLDFVYQPYRGPDGAVLGVMVQGVDLTDRVRAEAAMRASERAAADRAAELEAVLRAAPNAIWIAHDPGCRVVTGNPASYRLLDRPEGENVSATPAGPPPDLGFVHLRDGQPVPADELPLQQAADGRPVSDTELTFAFADGRVRHMFGNAAPLRDADGRVRGAVAAFVDVTALKELERQLRDADRRKDEFLATLAHELRNPLAPIRNGLQILRLSTDPAAVDGVREMMTRQVAHMVRLIDDLLDVSRITRGKIALHRQRVELADVVRQAVETSQPHVDAGGHALTVDLPADPLPVDADPVRLAQVLSNLLTNAAKYSDRGGRIRLAADRANGAVVVSVTDAGIGIPAEQLPRVFDLFAQVEAAAGHRQGGLGIGLSLVKGLVQLHGGSVSAHSDGVGRGSTFTVRLPAADDGGERPA